MSQYNPNKHHRRSIRLKGYDYSQAGMYFITICCQDRTCLLGEIVAVSVVDIMGNDDGQSQEIVPTTKDVAQMRLNDAGKMVEMQWLALAERFTNIELHEYVVMPNHFHGILEIIVGVSLVDTPTDTPKPKTIGDMMDAFKSITTVEYIRGVKKCNWQPFNGKLWQRNYYEIIIRNEQSYKNISNYIINNPAKWIEDKFHK